MNRPTRREIMQSGLAGAGALAVNLPTLSATESAAAREFSCHYDHIIGTSLDAWLLAGRACEAEAAERSILDEIERLRLIFSTYEPNSELSWLNRATGHVAVSPELLEVLQAYEVWQARSGGAFSGQLGQLVRVWADAEASGSAPQPDLLAEIVQHTSQPGWEIDEARGTVARLTEQPLNLNSIAKGFIIERAVSAALAKVSSLGGLLLNLGGDMRAWGRQSWLIGVQDPHHPHDNARPLTALQLRDAAVATSGDYLRFHTVEGERRSHLLDPRTGRSAAGVASATVVAADNVTANALATTLCILTPAEGLRLVTATPGAECLIVTAAGEQWRSPGLKDFEVPLAEKAELCLALNADTAWPAQFQVTINVGLPNLAVPRYRKPYVAVWVEDANKKPVRTLTVWGSSPKYLRDLFDWWKFAQGNGALIKAVTRATRAPGKYSVVWDGKDDGGTAVTQGTYTIKVEVHREHGKHLTQTGKINCGTAAARVTLLRNAEADATVVDYGKKKK